VAGGFPPGGRGVGGPLRAERTGRPQRPGAFSSWWKASRNPCSSPRMGSTRFAGLALPPRGEARYAVRREDRGPREGQDHAGGAGGRGSPTRTGGLKEKAPPRRRRREQETKLSRARGDFEAAAAKLEHRSPVLRSNWQTLRQDKAFWRRPMNAWRSRPRAAPMRRAGPDSGRARSSAPRDPPQPERRGEELERLPARAGGADRDHSRAAAADIGLPGAARRGQGEHRFRRRPAAPGAP